MKFLRNVVTRCLGQITGKEISVSSFLYTALSIIIIRTVLESLFENGHFICLNSSFYYVLVDYCHVSVSWLTLFILIITLLHYGSGDRFSASCNVGLFAFPVIILVPLLDFFIFGSGTIVYNYTFENFISSFLNTLNPFKEVDFVTSGVRIEIFLVLLFSGYYVHFKTKNSIRTAFTVFAIYSLIFVYGYLPAIYNFILNTSFQQILQTSVLPARSDVHYNLYMYLPFITLSLASVLHFASKNLKQTLLDAFRLSRIMIYTGLLLLGFTVSVYENGLQYDLVSMFDYFKIIFALLSVTTAFGYAVILNNICDIDIDTVTNCTRPLVRKIVSVSDYVALRNILFLFSVVFALAVNEQFVILTLFSIVLSYLYSSPPFRLRNHFISANLVLSLIGVCTFLQGVTIVEANMAFNNVNRTLVGFIFCYFFIAANLKDIKDVPGDKAHGVITVPLLVGSKMTLNAVKLLLGLFTLGFCAVMYARLASSLLIFILILIASFTIRHSEKYLIYVQVNLAFLVVAYIFSL